ncbi:MAG: class I SAM-dependent methyltransferase [Burkholderiaceae bacterium]|nr:class I SAM-dependent methyltransferase [Burkholderiaceae bacterium]
MAAYYRQRAAYYERVYHKPERQTDLRAMEAWLPTQFAGRHVLEVACGTGWWTPHGARDATHWLATDLNAETLAVARAKPLPACVRFAEVDAYSFAQIDGQALSGPFDAAFAGCWWSHVPLQRLEAWLDSLHQRLEPGARVVMLDNSFVQTSSTPISRHDDQGNSYQLRTLDDGSQHEVLKNFPTPDEAIARLGPRARDAQWIAHTHYWMLAYTLA